MLQTYLERENAGGQSFNNSSLFSNTQYFFLFYYNYIFIIELSDTEAALSRLDTTDTQGFELSPEARAQADLKFTYVVTCQIYGKQKEEQKPEAADIALLMQRWVVGFILYLLFSHSILGLHLVILSFLVFIVTSGNSSHVWLYFSLIVANDSTLMLEMKPFVLLSSMLSRH